MFIVPVTWTTTPLILLLFALPANMEHLLPFAQFRVLNTRTVLRRTLHNIPLISLTNRDIFVILWCIVHHFCAATAACGSICVWKEGSRLAARHWRGKGEGVSRREKVPPLSGAMHSGQGRTQYQFVVMSSDGARSWISQKGERSKAPPSKIALGP